MSAEPDTETYLGQSFEAAEAGLGPPASRETFTMHPGVHEFRIELRNIFKASETPEILEATWAQTPQQNLTLWFAEQDGTWRAILARAWHPDDEF